MGKVCHRLPINLDVCPVCGSGIKFTRSWTWIQPQRLFGTCDKEGELYSCHKDEIDCPVCKPPERAGLLWVGKKFYTVERFITEARELGVSKLIPAIPKGFEVGKTWVYLAHVEAGKKKVEDKSTLTGYRYEPHPAIFYAFRPTRVEMLIRESEATEEKLESLKKRGITPVIVPDDYQKRVKKAEEQYRKTRRRKRR
jgi:hypothetical protein